MYSIRIITDLPECRKVWQELCPRDLISDLWEVRDCFHRNYRHRPHFVVAERDKRVCGLLPLSWNEEEGAYTYFPGETWEGKTWLEQNRILADDHKMLRAMIRSIPDRYHLRYLQPPAFTMAGDPVVDEIGYLFVPPKYDYSIDRYFDQFSHKSAKRIRKEVGCWNERRLEYRYNCTDDFGLMIDMNLHRYGDRSYFGDSRFLGSFRSLQDLLFGNGWLRLTTLLIDGVPAAVDFGCLYNGTYTLLAGGTNGDFPGVAKVINLHHMQWACQQRVERVDFLCGDFNWKTLFHLSPRPLYLLQGDNRQRLCPAAWSVFDRDTGTTSMKQGGFAHA